ncbi:hypothetical protein VTN96DRAFT_9907 [Rasamsonia emersonii]
MAIEYHRVDEAISDEEEQIESSSLMTKRRKRTDYSQPSRQKWLSLRVIKDIVLFSLAAWGLVSIIQRLAIVPGLGLAYHSIPEGCDCGDSVAEAISRGCKFDSLAMAWLPEHCRDDELTAEFNTAGNGPNGSWVYYADSLRTIEVDSNTVAAMGDDPDARVHMNEQWHKIHCIFYWRKQFRTRFNGKIVEPRSDTENHIKHCGEIFLQPGSGTVSGISLNTNVEV